MPRPRLPIALPLALALACSACGGDDSLSAGQLRAQASAICKRTAAATDRIPLPSTASQGARFLRAAVAKLGPQTQALAALKPPSELRADYRKAVALGRDEWGLIEGNANAIDRGADPIDTIRDMLAPLAPILREENAYWRALQIPQCVRR